jgi:hypothetical protein
VTATYRALIATLRREPDGLLTTAWGLRDTATGEPVTTGQPGPARLTWGDSEFVHVGRDVGDIPACLLWKDLDGAEAWVREQRGIIEVGRAVLDYSRCTG